MQRKCHTCLCRTCLSVCGNCAECKEKITYCENYNGFEQMNIFSMQQEMPCQGAPRHPIEYYGLTNERVEELKKLIQSGRYASLVSQTAYAANKTIAGYIILSVKENKSYDVLRVKWELKEMERIPYCRTDFYGIRRYFYGLFDKELKKLEGGKIDLIKFDLWDFESTGGNQKERNSMDEL